MEGAAWARIGYYIALAGTALWTVSLSLDVAVASAAANWLSAEELQGGEGIQIPPSGYGTFKQAQKK